MPESIRDAHNNVTLKIDTDGSAFVKVLSQSDYTQMIENDVDGRPTYIGEASPGSLTSASVWRIKKITYTDGFASSITWAGGVNSFTKEWDDRATYVYS